MVLAFFEKLKPRLPPLEEREGDFPCRPWLCGFTAHEYLEDFKLYNMNGRLYDPVVGRFLSPDPFVQAPDFSQNFNRYSYCLNNPLKYTDPSGYKWDWRWLIPIFQFDDLMQLINDKTPKLRQKMSELNIPDFNVTASVNGAGNVNFKGDIMGQEVFNTENIDRSNAKQKANQAINDARQAGWQAEMEASYGSTSSWIYGTGIGLNMLGHAATGGEMFLNSSISFFESMNSYSAPVGLNYSKEISLLSNSAKTIRTIGGATIVVGAGLDIIGIFNYYNKGPMHPSAVSPGKAGLNLGMGAYSFYLNPIAGPLYFGVDLFYPGGWTGAINDQSRLIQKNQNILGPSWNMYKDIGGY